MSLETAIGFTSLFFDIFNLWMEWPKIQDKLAAWRTVIIRMMIWVVCGGIFGLIAWQVDWVADGVALWAISAAIFGMVFYAVLSAVVLLAYRAGFQAMFEREGVEPPSAVAWVVYWCGATILGTMFWTIGGAAGGLISELVGRAIGQYDSAVIGGVISGVISWLICFLVSSSLVRVSFSMLRSVREQTAFDIEPTDKGIIIGFVIVVLMFLGAGIWRAFTIVAVPILSTTQPVLPSATYSPTNTPIPTPTPAPMLTNTPIVKSSEFPLSVAQESFSIQFIIERVEVKEDSVEFFISLKRTASYSLRWYNDKGNLGVIFLRQSDGQIYKATNVSGVFAKDSNLQLDEIYYGTISFRRPNDTQVTFNYPDMKPTLVILPE